MLALFLRQAHPRRAILRDVSPMALKASRLRRRAARRSAVEGATDATKAFAFRSKLCFGKLARNRAAFLRRLTEGLGCLRRRAARRRAVGGATVATKVFAFAAYRKVGAAIVRERTARGGRCCKTAPRAAARARRSAQRVRLVSVRLLRERVGTLCETSPLARRSGGASELRFGAGGCREWQPPAQEPTARRRPDHGRIAERA